MKLTKEDLNSARGPIFAAWKVVTLNDDYCNHLTLTPETENAISRFIGNAYTEEWAQIGGLAWRCMLVIETEPGKHIIITDQMQWEIVHAHVIFYGEDGANDYALTSDNLGSKAIRIYATQQKDVDLPHLEVQFGLVGDPNLAFVMRNNAAYQTLHATLRHLAPVPLGVDDHG